MKRWTPTLFGALLAAGTTAAAAQTPAPSAAEIMARRPVPHPIVAPAGYQRAVQRGTRTPTGAPGPRYWQQWSEYRIRTSVDVAAKTLSGSEQIVYHNRSSDTLAVLYVQLHQNLHAPGVERNEENEVTGGVQLRRVAVRGQQLAEAESPRAAGYAVGGTMMRIRPAAPVLPGDSVRLDFEWSFKIAQAGASGRMGYDADNLVYLAYWYPQMAVYDDVNGWQTDPFLGSAEFYMGYGSYDYTVDAPAGWTVMGTGTLGNAQQVLAPAVLERWRRAAGSDSTVHVVTAADFGGRATTAGTNGRLTWNFRADSVRDVAFGIFRESLWDAARTPVGDRNGDGRTDYTLINSFYRQNAPKWARAVSYEQQAITHHSEFTGVRYPYPHMTAVEGENIIGGGMEYPMMTLISSYTEAPSDTALYSVIAHELGHMWFPMIVGVDERRFGWMDEGTTDFNENEAFSDVYPTVRNGHVREQQQYVQTVRAGADAELLRWTDYQTPNVRSYATYTKPATLLWALRGLVGDDVFRATYRTYAGEWKFKHPKPWDFFSAFNTGAGRNLDWFWSTWYAETWTLDQAIGSVTPTGNGATITVEDRGTAPMPTRLLVTRQNGSTARLEVPVETWLGGARSATVIVPASASAVIRVEIDPESYFPDTDRANNVWTRG